MIKSILFGLVAIAAAFGGGLASTLMPAGAPVEEMAADQQAAEPEPVFWDSGILVAPVIRNGTVAEYRTLNIIVKTGANSSPDRYPMVPIRIQEIYQELLLSPEFIEKMIDTAVNPKVISENISLRLTEAFPDSDVKDVLVVHADRFAPNELRKNLIDDNGTVGVGHEVKKGVETEKAH
ncbi:hypothetical protein CSC94_17875 [Zhengella mangrovi]|uniref:Flagellar protein FliL n=1 Tax=Zhengella mangrovi TaxID=1982044 RepID=A0A2G1QJL0_9HYPH|nr:hypothetical protein [Zhengella mangrovi]PHP65717.1 hypothetical protein CSC94_17875 [Zhengella mangrovi]